MTNRFPLRLAGVAWVVGAIAMVAGLMLLVWLGLAREEKSEAADPTQVVSAGRVTATAGRRDEDGDVRKNGRRGKEEGALVLTPAMVEALPSPLAVLEQDPEASAAVAAELARVDLILKKRRKGSIRGERIEVGRALRFPAQTDRELAALVSGMRMPAAISGDQAEAVRMMAMAQLAKEYGVARTVTPELKMNFSARGGEARMSFVNFQEMGGGGAEPVQWCPFLHGGAEASPWKYDFLVTPELAALEALATGKYVQRVLAGEDSTAAARAVCEEMKTPEGRR